MKQKLGREMKAKDITLGFKIGMIYKVLRLDEITWG